MAEEVKLSDQIVSLRTRLGMSQEDFARGVGVTVSTVNRWENGHSTPSKLGRAAIQAYAFTKNESLDGTPVLIMKIEFPDERED